MSVSRIDVQQETPVGERALAKPGSSNAKSENAPSNITRYTFLPSGTHSMVLIPSVEAEEVTPLYHISWREDFWSRGDFVTTIRKGDSEDGPLVGQFGYYLKFVA